MKAPASRLVLLAFGIAALVLGVAAGLVRLGWALPHAGVAHEHGALMVSGFLGTVISLERAVALGRGWALAAPAASALGTALLLAGLATLAHAAWIVAAVGLVAASVVIMRRQPLAHTRLLVAAAVAWLIGNGLHATGRLEAAVPWWLTFLVLTIAAERLELTRLRPRKPGVHATFAIAATALVSGAAFASGVAFGAGLVAVAAWLARYDIAWRTARGTGFARYAAMSLLGGYAWLAVGGLAWAAASLGAPSARDAALHAVGLGFVVSMILGHAPLVVPAIAKARLAYTPAFYAPLVLLHASLLVRLAPGLHDATWRAAGGVLNAATFVMFAATLAVALRRAR